MTVRSAATVALSVLLATALVVAAVPAPDERQSIGLLGQVTAKKETRPLANGNATIEADVTVNAAAARDAGARFILVSVGSDGTHEGSPANGTGSGNGTVPPNATAPPNATFRPVMKDGHVRIANDPRATVFSKEGAQTARLNFWYEASRLENVLVMKVAANTSAGPTPADVEVMIMAFNETYGPLQGADGRPLLVQTFTRLAAREQVPPPNGTGGPQLNETVDGGAPTPAPGLVALTLGLAAVAASARRR